MSSKAPRFGDAVIALALLALAVSGIVAFDSYDLDIGQAPGVRGYVLTVLMTLPLAWRQVFPRLTLWVVFVAWSSYVAIGYADSSGIFGVIVAMYGIGLFLERREALVHGSVVTALAVSWTLVGLLTNIGVHPLAIVQVIIAFVVPVGIGMLDRKRHRRLTELELEHDRRQQAQQAIAADAVRTERARIARELHDVVAHEVTVMTLQAEGARRMSAGADPRVTEALETISESGRKGLAEMQRMIGVLRASEADAALAMELDRATALGDTPRPHVPGRALDLSPMPSLATIPDLVSHVESAGLPVHLEISGTSHVPAGVELSAYRIVQESLTNALKHAGPGARAEVAVRRTPGLVTITVEDDGRGTISDAAAVSGGHGLTGMHERVNALGGEFSYGPRTGGGFRVHATLPTSDDQVTASRVRSSHEGDSA